jgi:hypothetical protein
MYQSGRLSDGEAFAGSVAKITKAADGFDRTALALDVGPSLRKPHCPTYKANRPDPGDAYRKMVRDVVGRLLKDGATAFPNKEEKDRIAVTHGPDGVPLDAVLYPEADDVIASLVAWFHRQNPGDWSLSILSGDTDLWALVDDSAVVTVQTLQGDVIFESSVKERFGGVGGWVTEVKALAGDNGDNYHPFPHYDPTKRGGIGEGKAVALLSKFGADGIGGHSANNVLTRALLPDGHELQMPDCHERKCLRAGGDAALNMGYTCARMLSDLPLGFERILAEPKVEQVAALHPIIKTPSPVLAKQERQTSALARYEPARVDLLEPNALQPQSLSELEDVGRMVVNSRIYPHIDCPEKAMIVIAEARERRVPFGAALRASYFVGGKLSWYSYYIVGLVRRERSIVEYFELDKSTQDFAVIVFKRVGRPERSFRYEIGEAYQAGYIKPKGKWETEPRTMLEWAAKRRCARAHFDDIVGGMHTPEELILAQGKPIDTDIDVIEGNLE